MLAGTMIQSKQLRKSILSVFVIVTIIQSTVAALQTGGIYIIEAYLGTTHTMENKVSYGLIQHFNWYAGLSGILFACTSGVFLYTNSKAVRNITYAVSLLSFYTLLSAEARLGWIGVAAYMLFLFVSIVVMKFKGLEKEKFNSIIKRL